MNQYNMKVYRYQHETLQDTLGKTTVPSDWINKNNYTIWTSTIKEKLQRHDLLHNINTQIRICWVQREYGYEARNTTRHFGEDDST